MFEEKSFKASAPGSLMLMGEYAVLYDKPALVCALDKRMTVTLTPRSDEEIHLISPRFGNFTTKLSQLEVVPPFHFVTTCLVQQRKKLKTGFNLAITSDFCDKIGFGSSAAVTVATLAALYSWLEPSARGALGKEQALRLIRDARSVIREVQGMGSGADVAASVLGGVVAYRATPLTVEKFVVALPLTVIYSGSKTPTPEAIRRVKQHFSSSPALFNTLCKAINDCAKEGIRALHENDEPRLGAAMNVQQGLMQALGVSTPLLDNLIESLRNDPATLGAKISGSGLGDCVLGLGVAPLLGVEEKYPGVKKIAVRVAQEGVLIHE